MRTDWQPFSTAPTDGTEILAYRRDAGVIVVCYQPGCYFTSEGDDDPEWFTIVGEHLCGDELPTHWMPLPEPPQDQCPICGDDHEGQVPLACETGDGV